MAWIQMRDFWTFRPTEVSENKRHLFECKDSKSDTGHSLLVHVAASHSAIVNGNRRFYRPDKMQESIHTWLPEKTEDGRTLRTPRPVLIGHDEKGDVLGRVLEAKYVDESWRYAGEFPVVKDFLFYQRDGRKRQTLYDSVDWIVDNLSPIDDYTGLGYTDLGLRITNPDAIRKVMDDEYLTVSVGFKTDAAVCSLCHTDWANDGKCGHKLGEIEDGKQMFLIAGSLSNQEVSFINFAADPFATTLSKETLTDSLSKMFFLGLPINQQTSAHTDGLQFTDGLIYESDMAATEGPMTTAIDMSALDLTALGVELKASELLRERALVIKDSLSEWTPESEDLKTKKRSLISTVNAKIRKHGWDKVQDSVDTKDATVAEELTALMEDAKKDKSVKPGPSGMSKGISKKSAEKTKNAQRKEINGVEHDEECDGAEGCLCNQEDAAPAFELFVDWVPGTDADRDYFADAAGIQGDISLHLVDHKASLDLIKTSIDSFCGPLSTFPVFDAPTAAASRKVIDAAKFSDELKDKIRSNISIKEAALPASVNAVDLADSATFYTSMIDSVLMKDAAQVVTVEERNALGALIKSIDQAYKALPASGPQWTVRYALRALMEHWSAEECLSEAMAYLVSKDHTVLTRSEIDEKDEAINGLMSEKDSLTAEIVSLKDSRTVILAATKHTLAQQIVMHHVLKGQDGFTALSTDQINEKIETLAKRHVNSLRDSVSDLLAGIKFTDSTPAALKSTETSTAVDDHTQITDATPTGATSADGVIDEAALEAQKLFDIKVRFMTPLQRREFLGRMRYQAVQTTK